MNLVVFLLALGSTCRITRLITKDTLTADFRSWTASRFGDDSKLSYLVTCGWCTSVWVAAAVVPLAQFTGGTPVFRGAALVLTLSYLAGLASEWLD